MITTRAPLRFLLFFILAVAFVSFLKLESHRGPEGTWQPTPIKPGKDDGSKPNGALLTGHAIAPKLGNATAKWVASSTYLIPYPIVRLGLSRNEFN